MIHSVNQLKRKLLQLKKLEQTIRFKGQSAAATRKLVWDVFFSTKIKTQAIVKYPLQRLLKMGRDELKAVFEEYFYRVYYQDHQDDGLAEADVYDPQLLALLGLPAYAGTRDLKKRYRELAKRYHPDRGGDSAKFIELVEVYEKLRGVGK